MFRNYLKIALRTLWKFRSYTAINVLGLALGMATCLVILLFVQDELSYDRYNEKADRMVRVFFRGSVQGEKMNESMVMPPVAQALKADYPEVLETTRLRVGGTPLISYGEKTLRESAFAFADSNFFRVFTIPLLKGDAQTALLQPNTVVVTRAFAQKYFNNDDPLGKVITLKSENKAYKITGLIDKVPANSHFHFDLFASMATLPEARSPSWMQSEFYTYLVLPEGYDYKRLEAKLPQVVDKYIGPQIGQAMGVTLGQFRQQGNDLGLFLQPLTDIHLHSNFAADLSPAGDIRYVYLFGAIALFMLLIAGINFVNLSTASASKRAKEVGIRKVMGSAKQTLVGQFLLESTLLTAISLLLAVVIVWLILPAFSQFAGKELSLNFLSNPLLLPGLLVFGLLVGVLAGGYPAFFLSSFKPITVLKGGTAFRGTALRGTAFRGTAFRGSHSLRRLTASRHRISLRSGLVVFQFLVSVTLTVGATVVYQQLRYMQNKALGYNKEQVVVLPETWLLGNKEAVFRDQLLNNPQVLSVSTSGYLPAGPSNNNNFFVYPDNNSAQLVKTLRYDVDYTYIPTLGMRVVAGRNFSKTFGTDSSAAILNETAARALGWGTNPLGHTVSRTDNRGIKQTYRVVGLVKDFHFKSLHERISPLIMVLGNNAGTVIVKAKTKDVAGLLTSLQTYWTALMPDAPFVYSFLDDRVTATYRAEQRTGQILGIFAGLTIFVACLGLFGLATFTAEQRTKEIGVRKVLGASVTSIVTLLSRDFLKLVLIAVLLASPVAGWAMNCWLQDFAYKIEIEWWVFAGAGLLAMSIALLTVSFQSIKAALMNPVTSLKSE